MKKLALIVGLFLTAQIFSPVNAAGQTCCAAGFTFDASNYECVSSSQVYIPPRAPSCFSNESCIGSGRGACSETGGGGECCDNGFYYNSSDGKCHGTQPSFPPRTTKCGSNQRCGSNNTCVVGSTTEPRMLNLCEFAGENQDDCKKCFEKDPPEAWTAIGCIPTSPSGFIAKFLGLGVGISGGIAFLLILFSGFQMMTSTGNPEKLNAGKELMTAAISGLVLIVFSIFLLRLIGVTILQLPEFGG